MNELYDDLHSRSRDIGLLFRAVFAAPSRLDLIDHIGRRCGAAMAAPFWHAWTKAAKGSGTGQPTEVGSRGALPVDKWLNASRWIHVTIEI